MNKFIGKYFIKLVTIVILLYLIFLLTLQWFHQTLLTDKEALYITLYLSCLLSVIWGFEFYNKYQIKKDVKDYLSGRKTI